jgi:penicillin G amidase
MLASLKSAMVEVEKKLGPDPKTWQWGKLHTAVFEHPLHAILDAQQRQQFDVNAGPIGGSSFTPMNTSYRNSDFQLTAGASFRMVVDVGNWDASRVVNTPGQSGNPANPHYRDLAPLWAKGEYFPLLYSRKAVEKESKERLELVPQ